MNKSQILYLYKNVDKYFSDVYILDPYTKKYFLAYYTSLLYSLINEGEANTTITGKPISINYTKQYLLDYLKSSQL